MDEFNKFVIVSNKSWKETTRLLVEKRVDVFRLLPASESGTFTLHTYNSKEKVQAVCEALGFEFKS